MRKILVGIIIFVVVAAYPIYAAIVYFTSKSPDPISMFPTDGVYVCRENDFSITIDLTGIEGEDKPALSTVLEQMKVVIEFDEREFSLVCFESGGHGTLISPVAPSEILTFKSADIDSADESYVCFSVSKYLFKEDEFYLKSFAASRSNKADIFGRLSQLHFIKTL